MKRVHPLCVLSFCALAGLFLAATLGCATAKGSGTQPEKTVSGAGVSAGKLKGDLTIFAAASLNPAFAQLAQSFEEVHPDLSITLNFDGSQRLRTQLEHGAQADLFASADWEQMEAVAAADLVQGQPISFAGNRLAFLVYSGFSPPSVGNIPDARSPTNSGGDGKGRESVTLQDLAEPGVKVVLALPEAPVGRYSVAVIANMGSSPSFGPVYSERLMENVVSREANVRSVAQKVSMGEADAGITYRTDALAPYVAERVRVLPIPDSLNVVADYPIAALQGTKQPEASQAFVDFVSSAKGQAILEQHGFTPPTNVPNITP